MPPSFSRRNNGMDGVKSSRRSYDENTLDFPVSSMPIKNSDGKLTCRALSCPKGIQGKDGFCRAHHNQYLICTGQCESWACFCGNKNLVHVKRCGICYRWRDGEREHPATKKSRNDVGDTVVEVATARSSSSSSPSLSTKKTMLRSDDDSAAQLTLSSSSSSSSVTIVGIGRNSRRSRSSRSTTVKRPNYREYSDEDDDAEEGDDTEIIVSSSSRPFPSKGSKMRRAMKAKSDIETTVETIKREAKSSVNGDSKSSMVGVGKKSVRGVGTTVAEGESNMTIAGRRRRRRRDRRPPKMYVARPSRSGLGVDDGDAMFLLLAESTVAAATIGRRTRMTARHVASSDVDDDDDDDVVVVAVVASSTGTMSASSPTVAPPRERQSPSSSSSSQRATNAGSTSSKSCRSPPKRKRGRPTGGGSVAAVVEPPPPPLVSNSAPTSSHSPPGYNGPPPEDLEVGLSSTDSEIRSKRRGKRDKQIRKGVNGDGGGRGMCDIDDATVQGNHPDGKQSPMWSLSTVKEKESPSKKCTEHFGTEEEARSQQLRISPSAPSSSCGGHRRRLPQDASSPSVPAALTVSSSSSPPSPTITSGGGLDDTDFERSILPFDLSRPPMRTSKTKASDVLNKPIERRAIGRRREVDNPEDPDCNNPPDDDEVVFISSSRGEGIGASTANGFSTRWSRRDPKNSRFQELANTADNHLSSEITDVDGHCLSRDWNEPDAELKSDGEPRLKPDVRTEDAFVDDDGLSLSDLGPSSLSLVKSEPVRERRLDTRVSFCCDESYWRCGNCGGLNPPTARCGTCRHFKDVQRTSERVLLERTRYELLSGRDFWICTKCEIAMPSLTAPCGGCRRLISFVPLERDEFEEFVGKQRQIGSFLRQGLTHENDTQRFPEPGVYDKKCISTDMEGL